MFEEYKEHRFKRFANARKKQKQMKKMFGYNPEIFEVTHIVTDQRHFVVVEPKGMKKIN